MRRMFVVLALVSVACTSPTAPRPAKDGPCWVHLMVHGLGIGIHFPHCPSADELRLLYPGGFTVTPG